MKQISVTLKNTIQSEAWFEIKTAFLEKAGEIRNTRIDRNKPYEEQGRQNHAQELAAEEIERVVKEVEAMANFEKKPKKRMI